jgi:glycosidase
MNRHAIYHEPAGIYAWAAGPESLAVMLRAGRADIDSVTIAYADRHEHPRNWRFSVMNAVDRDGLYEYWTATISLPTRRFAYYFILMENGREIWYGEGGFAEHVSPDAIWRWNFQYPYLWWDDKDALPYWAQEAIVYEIFPERFYNGDPLNDPPNVRPWGQLPETQSFFGGDLRGIIDKLDHLEWLGVNCLYLTPIFSAPSNHKYDTSDYYKIDPHFGDPQTARELVTQCHQRGIRVVLDAVFNHSGSDFAPFQDVVRTGRDSPYAAWFNIYKYPIVASGAPNYETFSCGIASMPKLMTDQPAVREYLIQAAEYWTRELAVDGWRLDVADEVHPDFWREFRTRIKAINPECLIIGEVMHDAVSFLTGDQFDTVMHYPWQHLCVDFLTKREPQIGLEEFADTLGRLRQAQRSSVTPALWNLFDSHDRMRILTAFSGKRALVKLATAFQFMYPGVPFIYYGDEIGMEGGEDPDCRRCMEWRQSEWDLELLAHYRALIKLRREKSAFSRGNFAQVLADGKRGVYVFVRWDDAGAALCLFNFSDNPVVVAAAEFLAPPNAPEVLSQTCQRGAGALGEVLTGSYQLCFSVDAEGGQASDSAAALGTRSIVIGGSDQSCQIELGPLCSAVFERVF